MPWRSCKGAAERPAIPEQLRQRQNALELQSQRAHDVARRLQQVQHELLEVGQQLTVHQRRMADYEAILQQESTILAGYQTLQQLREQERVSSAQAEEYTTLQQCQAALQQTITTQQYRLELEQHSAHQRQQELEQKIQINETFLQNAPSIAAAYSALQEARQCDTAMAQTLQERYRLEQEKSQVEFRCSRSAIRSSWSSAPCSTASVTGNSKRPPSRPCSGKPQTSTSN